MGASGRVARDPSECGGAPSRLSATPCRAPPLILRPAAPKHKLLASVDATPPRPPRRALHCRTHRRTRRISHDVQDEAQSGAAWQARSQHAQAAAPRRGADALEAALLARLPGAPAAHAPPSSPHAPERTARPPSARPCAPSRPSSSWPTCTRCPWKTPTSTQRLTCSPPSLPLGCSMPDGLLDG